jgi:3,4-dihydroxy 2-butanone 4-phosphate synthase/GTP cyclohydrolase II
MFANVKRAIADIQQGNFVILTDDANRENEGDLVLAGCFADASKMAFLMSEARGLVCISMSEYYTRKLELHPMTSHNQCLKQTAYTITVDAKPTTENGCTTGISAHDRAITIQTLLNPHSTALDLVKPGHLQPLLAKAHGLFERQGHTEGSVALMQLAGLPEVAVICEMVNSDGTMARSRELQAFASKHSIAIVSIAEIVQYLQSPQSKLELSAKLPILIAKLPVLSPNLPVRLAGSSNDEKVLIRGNDEDNPTLVNDDNVIELRAYALPGDNLAVFHPNLFTTADDSGANTSNCSQNSDDKNTSNNHARNSNNNNITNDVSNATNFITSTPNSSTVLPPIVRLHSKCLTGDVFGSLRCDCGEQLQQSLRSIAQDSNNPGLILYLGNQEGRGIGLQQKILSYRLQDQFQLDTVDANHRLGFAQDHRSYEEAAFILKHYFQLSEIRLLTGNPDKVTQLQKYGIRVHPIIHPPAAPTIVNSFNRAYLCTKQQKMGFLF